MFYLDNNATTRMYPEAIEQMVEVQRYHSGNASSLHTDGATAREILEKARRGIAGMIGCKPRELYFTSGGTEANNWAFHGILQRRPRIGIITSSIEHKSVLKAAAAGRWDRPGHKIFVDKDGVIDLDNLKWGIKEMKRDCLVSVMLANNETGVIQPVRKVVELVKYLRPTSLVHTDAVQMFGKHPVNVQELGVDLMTISSHKIGGPTGIGALYVREGVGIDALILGGHQEHDRRAGTENVAAAVGFQVAAGIRSGDIVQLGRRPTLEYAAAAKKDRDELEAGLFDALDDIWANGGKAERLCNTLNVGFRGVDSEALVLLLSGLEVAVSNGSACDSAALEGSHVLQAMGQSEEESRSAIRFSFTNDLPEGCVKLILKHVIESVKALRRMTSVKFGDLHNGAVVSDTMAEGAVTDSLSHLGESK